MSNFEPLNAQPDWQDQYSSYPPPAEPQHLSPTFQSNSNANSINRAQEEGSEKPALIHRHSINHLRQDPQQVPTIERPDSAPPGETSNQSNDTAMRNNSLASVASTTTQSIVSNPMSVTSKSEATKTDSSSGLESNLTRLETKSEGEEEVDDEDMLEMDDEPGAGHDENGPPQTAAERMAERRKMKRFR
jgi:hypothetical protein